MAGGRLGLFLEFVDVAEKTLYPLQRRDISSKRPVQDGVSEIRLQLFQYRQGQIALGREEVIKTAFLHPGLVTDLLHAHVAVTACVNQLAGSIDDALAGIGYGIHADNLVDWSVKIKV